MSRMLLLVLALALCSLRVSAQTPSTKPITIVVTTTAGGSVDAIARQVGQDLTKAMGRTVIVENKPGANGNIAAEFVRRAAPDGNTLLMLSSSTLTLNPLILERVPFDPVKDFAPVAMTARLNMVLVVNPKLEARDLQEFVAQMKAKPDSLSYGSSGNGSLPHVAGELLAIRTGTRAVHVPYKGIAPALNDLLGGQINYMFDSGTAMSHINSGRLRALAVIGPNRLPIFPNVPTFKEAGIAGMETASGWHGIFAPAATSPETIARLNKEINIILATPAMRERLQTMGFEGVAATPAELGRAVREDLQRLGPVVKQAKITAD